MGRPEDGRELEKEVGVDGICQGGILDGALDCWEFNHILMEKYYKNSMKNAYFSSRQFRWVCMYISHAKDRERKQLNKLLCVPSNYQANYLQMV